MTPRLPALIGPHQCGPGQPLLVIAGPCVIESASLCLQIGEALAALARRLPIQVIFKASFDKANRTSAGAFRGVGLDEGLAVLETVRRATGLPVTTDIHLPEQAAPVGRICDLLQIPAFLCRQTDLLVASGRAAATHVRAVNVKKGQFLSPGEMSGPVRKLTETNCHNVMLTERGTFFGYGRLVNDFLGLGDLMELKGKGVEAPPPVCFDCTHSTQLPGAGEQTGGRPDRAPLLAKAAVAAGVHAVFIECHPEPSKALSDASTMLPLASVPALLKQLAAIRAAV